MTTPGPFGAIRGNFFMERKSEKICKKGFTKFLLQTVNINDIKWEPVVDDPPDYYLTLFGQKRFAVEVTESKIYCEPLMDKEKVREREYRNYHTRYIKEIELEAKEKGILRGAYFIEFKYPVFKRSNYRKFLGKLKNKYFEYLKMTLDLDSADKLEITHRDTWISSISKVYNKKDIIYPMLGMRLAWVDSPENKQLVRNFLQEAINDKKIKLEKKTVKEPKILLLYDSYLLDEISTYSFEDKALKNMDYFHTIFIQFAGGEWLIYYSKNTDDFLNIFRP